MSLTVRKTAYSTIGLFACGALVAGSVAPAAASDEASASASDERVVSSGDSPSSSSELVGSNTGITDDIIAKYDEYVESDENGNYVLNLPSDFDADPEEIEVVENSITQSNEVAHEQSAADEAAIEEFSAGQDLAATSTAADGGFSVHWWGTQIWLNGPATDNLNRLLGAGAGVSALTAAIMSWTGVGGAVAGVVAGAFAAGAGVANLCNWNDNGISIRNPHVGPVICWPR